jgi:hypothetical protein
VNERSELIESIRGELAGPSRTQNPRIIEFNGSDFQDPEPNRSGQLGWRPVAGAESEEVLYFDRETPHRKYGVGLLHPVGTSISASLAPDQLAAVATDSNGTEPEQDQSQENASGGGENEDENEGPDEGGLAGDSDDFDVTSPDVRHPSTMGMSFCVRLNANGKIIIRLPQCRRFAWQSKESQPFPLNGRYEQCIRRWTNDKGRQMEGPMWRRLPAMIPDSKVTIDHAELVSGKRMSCRVVMPEGSPISLLLEVFPRQAQGQNGVWLLTMVLRNSTKFSGASEPRAAILYQSYFDVSVEGGNLEKYPESQRPFEDLDEEEKSLALLYRESATWAIGHGCAAGWDAEPSQAPEFLYADVMPAVQIPSMTADITDASGNPIVLSMRTLSELREDGTGEAWTSLENLAAEYAAWINLQKAESEKLPVKLQGVARKHIIACGECNARIERGIELLRTDGSIRKAFRLANLAMILQQIATKQLVRRFLEWNKTMGVVVPGGGHQSPWEIFVKKQEKVGLGSWRAFQIAFLLMSLEGVTDGGSPDREIVDLIWFPTGGGKTEAYLGVMAFYIFHERLLMNGGSGPMRDGTNVLMRYTLRMLTTQQFQRAAALMCAMEFLRRHPKSHSNGVISGRRFSLGLWVGSDGSPNNIKDARTRLGQFRRDLIEGNPLVLIECPWCRAEIGRYNGERPNSIRQNDWPGKRTRGIHDDPDEGPLLLCTDNACEFGAEHKHSWLPIEVIDDRIFQNPPSLVIATADKFAMTAYRPHAGALFGRRVNASGIHQENMPPGLIIQDELHLISGPLGTMYALYEGIFERLCSVKDGERWIKPKLIASTATIRGADDQVKALYDRSATRLFPSPGLLMGDSFFGRYARSETGKLMDGRLYLGIHAADYGSILTTQVRTFASALFRPYSFSDERKDAWWSLLAFYNSIRELSGAKTLFDSDIRSRLKFIFNREGFPPKERRNLRIVEELTSRLSQPEIVGMMDRLSEAYKEGSSRVIDACLASNIIEVGVDIDRLSLMGVVGQPKTTAQYIQVTGRVGRKWWERPGLILMIYNPSKSRDRSHFEQFHSYHRRLYERVEPTSATPFALSAIQRALPGALLTWARQHSSAPVQDRGAYERAIVDATELLIERCQAIQDPEDVDRSVQELLRISAELMSKWNQNPQDWEKFPPSIDGEYLMLWPGQFATRLQKDRGVVVASSMRQVDGSAELNITSAYALGQS